MGTIFRAIAAYWFLLFIVRIIGRRRTQMTPFELILIFLIGGMSIQAIVSDDRSLTNAFLAISAIALMHILVAWLKHLFPRFAKAADGTPIVIIDNGNLVHRRMDQLRVENQDLMAVAREQGITKLEEIKYAIMERNGGISLIKKSRDSGGGQMMR